jgi:hypothetical protein
MYVCVCVYVSAGIHFYLLKEQTSSRSHIHDPIYVDEYLSLVEGSSCTNDLGKHQS